MNAVDDKIVLEMDMHKYKFLTKTIVEHKKLIDLLKLTPVVRDTLRRDVFTIITILQNAEKDVKKGVENDKQNIEVDTSRACGVNRDTESGCEVCQGSVDIGD